MHWTFRAFLPVVLLALSVATVRGDDKLVLSRIAFGSCAPPGQAAADLGRGRRRQAGASPLARRQHLRRHRGHGRDAEPSTPSSPPCRASRRSAKACPILATWDDHDLGVNDGGSDYPKKDESQKLFLDFFGDRRGLAAPAATGVYDARGLRPPEEARAGDPARHALLPQPAQEEGGQDAVQRRTLRSRTPTRHATMLGEDQWRWLDEQLKVPAEVRAPRLEHPGRRRGPRLGEVDELPARARAALQR